MILCCGEAVRKCETSCGWHGSTSLCRTETCDSCDSRSSVAGRLAMNDGLGRRPGVSGSSRLCDQEGDRDKTGRKFAMSPLSPSIKRETATRPVVNLLCPLFLLSFLSSVGQAFLPDRKIGESGRKAWSREMGCSKVVPVDDLAAIAGRQIV